MKQKLMLLGMLLCMPVLAYSSTETFILQNECSEGPEICTQETGIFSVGTARIGGKKFTATDSASLSTCCQLASDIHTQACDAGKNPKSATVYCN